MARRIAPTPIQPAGQVGWFGSRDSSLPLATPPSAAASESGWVTDGMVIREIPPVPGTGELLMSALASVAVWHLLKGARHWQLASFPDWYHVEGPTQIGRSHAYDFQVFALPLCCPCEPAATPRASVWIGVPRSVKGGSQQALLPYQGRGPPGSSQA